MTTATKYNFSSKFFTNNSEISNIKSLTFNYGDATINLDRFMGYINGTYASNSTAPNLVYTVENTTYNCTADKIYFTTKSHSVSGVNADGELIIHHSIYSSQGSPFNHLYTVFLLHQSDETDNNDLDNMMSTRKNSASFNLNNMIKDDLCIQYLSPNSQPPAIVILFTTPIQINTIPSIPFDPRTLFKYFNAEYDLVSAKKHVSEGFMNYSDYSFAIMDKQKSESFGGMNSQKYSIKEGFVEGLETSDVNNMLSNMECEWIPYDMSGNQDVVKTYLVESTFLSNKTTNDAMVMLKYFLFFVMFIFLIYIFVPMFYIFLAFRSIKNENRPKTKTEILISIGGMEILFNSILMFIAVFFLILSQAYSTSPYVRAYTMIGFFTLVFWMISYLLIEIQKYTTPLLMPLLNGQPMTVNDVPPFGKRLGAVFSIFSNITDNLAADNSGAAKRML
jgi:hypothetical protein